MKRFLSVLSMVILSAFLISVPAFADAAQKQVTALEAVTEEVSLFVKVGQQPDLSKLSFVVSYSDNTIENYAYDSSMLVSFDSSKTGRQPALFEVCGSKTEVYFIVYDETASALRFKDVTLQYWGYKQIRRGVMAGFFVGVADDLFGVADGMTRAQFCQMIYSIYRNDPSVMTAQKQVSFTDVAQGSWYYEAVSACAAAGIVNGMGDGSFCPNNNITRQDVAVIVSTVLFGAEQIAALDVDALVKDARETLGIACGDFDNVSEYAKKYVAAALGNIYYGDQNGNINPKSNITRTECAAMCSNLFFKGFTDPENETPPVTKKIVYLSPSNQNSNPYAIYDKNDAVKVKYTEGVQMQLLGDKIAKILEQRGYEVYIADVSTPIKGEDVYNRADEAKDLNAACYVALHSNAMAGNNDGKYQGTTCYYNGNNKGAKELSDLIYDKLGRLTPTKDRGSLNDMETLRPFAEVRLPEMANVLIEVEFHDYAVYAQWIVDNLDPIANSIADGIDQYLKTL